MQKKSDPKSQFQHIHYMYGRVLIFLNSNTLFRGAVLLQGARVGGDRHEERGNF